MTYLKFTSASNQRFLVNASHISTIEDSTFGEKVSTTIIMNNETSITVKETFEEVCDKIKSAHAAFIY